MREVSADKGYISMKNLQATVDAGFVSEAWVDLSEIHQCMRWKRFSVVAENLQPAP